MNDRHQILHDDDFWLRLEFDMSGRLSQSHDKSMRKYWIDGFMPESIENTKSGVNVEGVVWIAEGSRFQTKFRFLARVSQELLHRKIQDFEYDIVCFDVEREYLELDIQKRKPNR